MWLDGRRRRHGWLGRLCIGFIQPDAAAAAALGLDLHEATLGFRTTAADLIQQARPEVEPEPDPATRAVSAPVGQPREHKAPTLSKGCRVKFRVALDGTKESAHAGRRLRAVSVVQLPETSTFCECCQIECGNVNRLAQHTAGRKHQQALLGTGGTAADLQAAVEATTSAASNVVEKKRQMRQTRVCSTSTADCMIPIAPHRDALVRSKTSIRLAICEHRSLDCNAPDLAKLLVCGVVVTCAQIDATTLHGALRSPSSMMVPLTKAGSDRQDNPRCRLLSSVPSANSRARQSTNLR